MHQEKQTLVDRLYVVHGDRVSLAHAKELDGRHTLGLREVFALCTDGMLNSLAPDVSKSFFPQRRFRGEGDLIPCCRNATQIEAQLGWAKARAAEQEHAPNVASSIHSLQSQRSKQSLRSSRSGGCQSSGDQSIGGPTSTASER